MGQSKRKISTLPNGWADRLLDAAANHWQEYQSDTLGALCVLSAIGCRPSELALGVKIRKVDDKWQFAVNGTKCGETGGDAKASQRRGVPFRQIEVEAVGRWSAYLEKVIGTQGEVSITSPDALYTKMRRLSKAEFPKSKTYPSPYSFRHATARELRSGGASVVEIAQVLGHASCTSQSAYGWTRAGGSKGPKRSAVASVKPRNAEKAQASKNFKGDKLTRFRVASKLKRDGKQGGALPRL